MTTDPLNTLLIQLAAMQPVARAMVARQYPADAVWDWERTNRLYLGLNETEDGEWVCGWLMRPGACAYMVVEAFGRTTMDAALALRKTMIEGE